MVCVTVRGKDDDRQNPGDYIEWLTHSCWKPRFRVEEYRLRPNAYTVQGVLDYDGGQMTTPILTIKPEPIDREPFPTVLEAASRIKAAYNREYIDCHRLSALSE